MSERSTSGIVAGNVYDKYRARNPIHRWLLAGFLKQASRLLTMAGPGSIIEVGCGPGDLAARLLSFSGKTAKDRASYIGTDLSAQQVEEARSRYPELQFQVASAHDLPFDDQCVDLLLLCEVLEHLGDPLLALSEAARVSREFVLASVPWEPVWRTLNLFRGKYWSEWGNTPGHVQHFTRRGIVGLVNRRFDIMAARNPLPWTMLLARKKAV